MVDTYRMADLLSGDRSNTVGELMEWQKKIFKEVFDANPRVADKIANLGHVPIYMLPYKRQVQEMGEYRRIIGLDEAINSVAGVVGERQDQVKKVFESLNTIRGPETGSGFVRFPATGDDDIDKIYRGLNLQHSERPRSVISGLFDPESSGTAASHFGPGVSSIPVMSERRMNMPSTMAPGSRFTTFDIETASLMSDQIREVSYHSGVMGAAGEFGNLTSGEAIFKPRMFNRGSMGMADESGKVVPLGLEDFMHQRHGMKYRPLETKSGEDFAENMIPFLKTLKESDNIIGHNILSFDIPQVFTSLAGTKRYGSDKEFRNLVDTTKAHVDANAIDTLVLARESPHLTQLKTADELLARGDATTHSIENLLLQTDLGERIGFDKLKGLMGDKGLHFGEVDDVVTLGLFEHLPHLKMATLGAGQASDHISNILRHQILESAAITPFTNIRKQSDIADSALKAIIGMDNGIAGGSTGFKEALADARSGNADAVQTAFDMIRSGQESNLRFNINPIEHQALTTRRLGELTPLDKEINANSLIFNNNIFDRRVYGNYRSSRNFSAGILGQKPLSDMEMRDVQASLHRAGMPFAGLSYEERTFATSLSHMTSGVEALPINNTIKSFTSDALVSTFAPFNPDDVAYTVRSGARPSMPISLLEDAGLLKDGDAQLLRLSTVDPTAARPEASVNLVYDFQNGGNTKFADYLEALGADKSDKNIAIKLGIDVGDMTDEEIEGLHGVKRFREALKNPEFLEQLRNSPESGVAVAQLHPREANSVIEGMRNWFGADRLADDSMIPMGLPYMGRTENGFVQTAGAVLKRHLGEEARATLPREVAQAKKVTEAYKEIGSKARLSVVANLDAQLGGDVGTKMIERGYEAYQHIRPHFGAVAGGILLLGAGMHIFKRHEENKQYDEVLAQQPTESGGNYGLQAQLQARMDSGIDRSYQRYDPLSTAFVVSNLDQNKTNHALMGAGKNSVLYGGVLS